MFTRVFSFKIICNYPINTLFTNGHQFGTKSSMIRTDTNDTLHFQ